MTAALSLPVQNLRVPAGSRSAHTFPRPSAASGSGWTGRGQFKPSPTSAVVYWQVPSSAITVDTDEVTLTVPGSVSRLWAWTAGVYLLELVPTSGDPVRVARGHVVVDPWSLDIPAGATGLVPPFYPPQYPSAGG